MPDPIPPKAPGEGFVLEWADYGFAVIPEGHAFRFNEEKPEVFPTEVAAYEEAVKTLDGIIWDARGHRRWAKAQIRNLRRRKRS